MKKPALAAAFVVALAAPVVVFTASPAMSQPEPNEAVEVVTAMFEAFNRHDVEAMAALYADDAFVNSPDFEAPKRGPEAIREIYGAYFASSPDIRDEVTRIFGSGDHVAVEFVSRGTMTHPAPGTPEVMRDKAFALEIAAVLEVRDGKIVRDVTYFDQLSVLRQMGLAE